MSGEAIFLAACITAGWALALWTWPGFRARREGMSWPAVLLASLPGFFALAVMTVLAVLVGLR